MSGFIRGSDTNQFATATSEINNAEEAPVLPDWVIRLFVFSICICIEISTFFKEKSYDSIMVGVIIFTLALGIQVLEFIQPHSLIVQMPCYIGRSLILLFLSILSIRYSVIAGITATLLSFSLLGIGLLTGQTYMPAAIFLGAVQVKG